MWNMRLENVLIPGVLRELSAGLLGRLHVRICPYPDPVSRGAQCVWVFVQLLESIAGDEYSEVVRFVEIKANEDCVIHQRIGVGESSPLPLDHQVMHMTGTAVASRDMVDTHMFGPRKGIRRTRPELAQ